MQERLVSFLTSSFHATSMHTLPCSYTRSYSTVHIVGSVLRRVCKARCFEGEFGRILRTRTRRFPFSFPIFIFMFMTTMHGSWVSALMCELFMVVMWTVFVVGSVHVWWLKPRQDENVRVSWNASVYKALANAPAAFHGVIIALLAWPIRSTAGTVAYALLAGAYWASYVDARERRAAANAEANQARDFCDARVCPTGAGEEGMHCVHRSGPHRRRRRRDR